MGSDDYTSSTRIYALSKRHNLLSAHLAAIIFEGSSPNRLGKEWCPRTSKALDLKGFLASSE
jgi:hypothetical protein